MGIPPEHLSHGLGAKIVSVYFKYMVDLAVTLGANRDQAKKELNQTLVFEIELAKVLLNVK